MRGKAGINQGSPASLEDHPRLCGEKYYYLKSEGFRHRITPAYAGKRMERGALRSNVRDHPRLCGEKYKAATAGKKLNGSPPPMRGKEDVL